MERFCGGDAPAFDALFRRHGPAVQAFLGRMVSDAALAEDLLQTTFLSVVRSRGRFTPGSRVLPWIFAIASNAARDALRRRKSRPEDLAAAGAPAADLAVHPPAVDPGLSRELEAALDALPALQREALVMHKINGLSFEEIAQALGTTSTAVRIRAHRAYERLRQTLGHLREP